MNKHFIIIGAQRSGTTYLYNLLDEHPNIVMAKPVKPEPKYFMREKCDYSDYFKKYFFKTKGLDNVVLGEKSTSYIEDLQSSANIANTIKGCKILVLLRNPVFRAISNYKFSNNNGLDTRELYDAISNRVEINDDVPNISVNPFKYVERGEYLRYLEQWEHNIDKENIKIVISESLFGNLTTIQDIYKFLGVDNQFCPLLLNNKINSSEGDKISEKEEATVKYLYEHYKDWNVSLQSKYNLDLSLWEANSI